MHRARNAPTCHASHVTHARTRAQGHHGPTHTAPRTHHARHARKQVALWQSQQEPAGQAILAAVPSPAERLRAAQATLRLLRTDPFAADVAITMFSAALYSHRRSAICTPFPPPEWFLPAAAAPAHAAHATAAPVVSADELPRDCTAVSACVSRLPAVVSLCVARAGGTAEMPSRLALLPLPALRLVHWLVAGHYGFGRRLRHHQRSTGAGAVAGKPGQSGALGATEAAAAGAVVDVDAALAALQPRAAMELRVEHASDRPEFRRLAAAYGTAVAFHGTSVENVHSILARGLKSMSGTEFEQTGPSRGARTRRVQRWREGDTGRQAGRQTGRQASYPGRASGHARAHAPRTHTALPPLGLPIPGVASGAVFGEGVYLARDLDVAMGFASVGKGKVWGRSRLVVCTSGRPAVGAEGAEVAEPPRRCSYRFVFAVEVVKVRHARARARAHAPRHRMAMSQRTSPRSTGTMIHHSPTRIHARTRTRSCQRTRAGWRVHPARVLPTTDCTTLYRMHATCSSALCLFLRMVPPAPQPPPPPPLPPRRKRVPLSLCPPLSAGWQPTWPRTMGASSGDWSSRQKLPKRHHSCGAERVNSSSSSSSSSSSLHRSSSSSLHRSSSSSDRSRSHRSRSNCSNRSKGTQKQQEVPPVTA